MNKRLERVLIVLVLIGQLLAQGIYLPVIDMFPLYLWLLMILGSIELVNWFSTSKGVISVTYAHRIPFILCLLSVNAVIVYLLNFVFEIQQIGLLLFSMAFVLACYNAVNTVEDLKFFLNTYVILVCVSAIVEIGQFLNFDFCFTLWEYTHVGEKLALSIRDQRFIGLAPDALQFGYHCPAAFAIVIFSKFEKYNFTKKILCICILVFAIITNNTRSAIIAVALVLIVWFFHKSREPKYRFLKVLFLLLGIVGLFASSSVMTVFQESRFASISTEASSMSRIPMFFTAFNHALHHPLGMGNYKVSQELIVFANSATTRYVEMNTAHNCIGNCVASFGFVGLGLFLLLYRNILVMYRREIRFWDKNNLYYSIVIAIIALFVNSLFHNSYVLNGEFSTVFFLGLFISAAKMKKPKKL